MGHREKCPTILRRKQDAPAGWRTMDKGAQDAWIRSLRPVMLAAFERSIALTLATYANKGNGQNARPGNERLAWASGTSVITVRRTLDKLQGWWLIHCAECGNGRGHGSIWWLTFRDDMDSLSVTFEAWWELHL